MYFSLADNDKEDLCTTITRIYKFKGGKTSEQKLDLFKK